MDAQPEAGLPTKAPAYAFRPSWWNKAERVARLDPEALVVADGDSVRRIALDGIKAGCCRGRGPWGRSPSRSASG
jgi:hypothetical protein